MKDLNENIVNMDAVSNYFGVYLARPNLVFTQDWVWPLFLPDI
jgi:hypothetical protein